ncbi:DUF488 domain-containing protein [Mesorhizobium sp. ESP-6-4]|uniref:DUF488 domain-containing protein n=1 Tax=Mesorhizobium sp. ESP-6-4 TaxID=2876624 RepID=UPI001CCA5093|nr:DUF488 domain-containing protein [Mesorhizobium sp. ESP-6-4]MBZ9661395.1 DUF488 domain-containing protein [Mesorhizobium sp. ESP-6-4]
MTHRREILTIGHSTLSYEQFLHLLRRAGVTAVADVRSAPYSRHFPHFNRDALRQELRQDNIDYRFVGEKLGGRPADKTFFCEGVADYERMAMAPAFKQGLELVVEGAKKHRIAIMCSEHDPLDCHRCLLVSRALAERGMLIKHILSDGSIVGHNEIVERLLRLEGKLGDDLFLSQSERLAAAYRKRARKVAYAERPPSDPANQVAAE